ncbi:MAG: hypothetical protein OJF58_003920 [Enhydrobacter sp.]|jgi:hypothetical protein|nr:MAG: hypothetical protein OJF58_003920 [Enhydrobacter sp.]
MLQKFGEGRQIQAAARSIALKFAELTRISQTIISDVMIGGQSKMVARVDAAKRERA